MNIDAAGMANAQTVSTFARCSRAKVGAAIYDIHGVLKATGFNRVPPGSMLCDHTCDCNAGSQRKHAKNCRSLRPCLDVIHAEAEAIAACASNGYRTALGTMYVTLSPCKACAGLILAAGIVRVVYAEDYRDPTGLTLLRRAGVRVERHG